jgi:hypothetical protein
MAAGGRRTRRSTDALDRVKACPVSIELVLVVLPRAEAQVKATGKVLARTRVVLARLGGLRGIRPHAAPRD